MYRNWMKWWREKLSWAESANLVCGEGRVERYGFAVGVFQLHLLRAAGQRRNRERYGAGVLECGYGVLAAD